MKVSLVEIKGTEERGGKVITEKGGTKLLLTQISLHLSEHGTFLIYKNRSSLRGLRVS